MTHDGSAYDHQVTDDLDPAEPLLPGSGSEDLDDHYEPTYLGGARRKKTKRRSVSGCLAVLIALVVVVGGAYYVGTQGYHYLKDHLSHAADYSGPGHGSVLFQVQAGRHRSARSGATSSARGWWRPSTRSPRPRTAAPRSRWATTS